MRFFITRLDFVKMNALAMASPGSFPTIAE
jgi:hypothetical protein